MPGVKGPGGNVAGKHARKKLTLKDSLRRQRVPFWRAELAAAVDFSQCSIYNVPSVLD